MTIREIAKELKVSPSTVSLVLNNRKGVSEKTRAAVMSSLLENGYSLATQTKPHADKPRLSIRLLKYKKHSKLVDQNANFVSSIIDAIEEECRKMGFNLLITTVGEAAIEEVFSLVCQAPFNGVILIGTEFQPDDFHYLEEIPVPVVIVDSPAINFNFDCVTMNNEEIVYHILRYLRDMGHRDIGYLHSNLYTGNFESRYLGYIKASTMLDMPEIQNNIIEITPTFSEAYTDMCELLNKGIVLPSALFADNDTIALGCMRALASYDYRLPEQVSIVGIDDVPFSAISSPQLSSMHISCSELGRNAVQLLLKKMENPSSVASKIFISGNLVERSSVARKS